MSRATEVLNDLEMAAHKLGMSIEDAVLILLGKHATHTVVQTAKVEEAKAPADNLNDILPPVEATPNASGAATDAASLAAA